MGICLRRAGARRVCSSNIPDSIWDSLPSEQQDKIEAYQVTLGRPCRPLARHGIDAVSDGTSSIDNIETDRVATGSFCQPLAVQSIDTVTDESGLPNGGMGKTKSTDACLESERLRYGGEVCTVGLKIIDNVDHEVGESAQPPHDYSDKEVTSPVH